MVQQIYTKRSANLWCKSATSCILLLAQGFMREVALWLKPQNCSCTLCDTPSTGTSLKGSFVRTIVSALCSSIVSTVKLSHFSALSSATQILQIGLLFVVLMHSETSLLVGLRVIALPRVTAATPGAILSLYKRRVQALGKGIKPIILQSSLFSSLPTLFQSSRPAIPFKRFRSYKITSF